MLKLAVLGSGKGSNCQSIIDAIADGRLEAKVQCVISDIASAYILERARRHDIPAFHVDHAPFKTKLEGPAEQIVLNLLRDHHVDFIALAGYMRMIKGHLLTAFEGHIINIHPSLLPAFPGLASWKQAFDYGAKVTGCTVHYIDAGMDTGPIILQKTVPILDNDTYETVHARIQEQEHIAYPEALQLISTGRVRIAGRHVHVHEP